MNTIGSRLRAARERKKLKQIQVKEKTGINNKTLSGYENGVSEPDLETLKILANLYEVSTDWLLGKEIKNEKESEFSLPENIYEEIIRKTEEKYNVTLWDDPFVVETMKQIIDNYARTKLNR